MQIELSKRDTHILSIAAMIGKRGTGQDFVAIDGKRVKTKSDKQFQITLFANLDNPFEGSFAFSNLGALLSIMADDPKYDLKLDHKKGIARIKSMGRTCKLPIVTVNEFNKLSDLTFDEENDPVFKTTSIETDERITEEIKKCVDGRYHGFLLSEEFLKNLSKDARRIGAKVLRIAGKDGKISIKLQQTFDASVDTSFEYLVDGHISDEADIMIPYFPRILTTDMEFTTSKETVIIKDVANKIVYIVNCENDATITIENIQTDFDTLDFGISDREAK